MAEIARSLVRRELDLGGHVLLMSATLGEVLRSEMEQRKHLPFAQAVAAPYPAVSSTSGIRIVSASATASSLAIEHHDTAIQRVFDCVRGNGCALVIRSTVDTATQTYQELVDADVPAMLHHSRYADTDRQYLVVLIVHDPLSTDTPGRVRNPGPG